MILNFLQFFKNYHQMHFLNWVEKEQLQTQKTHPGMCDLIIREYKINNLGTLDSPHITQSVACENSCFSLLFAAEDVLRGGMSATQQQKLHTDDVNQC